MAFKHHNSEPTQPGNPHGLAIRQHVFPVASIKRFANCDGRVAVYLLDRKKEVRLRPKDQIFCAIRAWSEAVERGDMRNVERKFQVLAERILNGNHVLDINDHLTITHFYALCRLRADARESPIADSPMKVGLPISSLTKNEEEILERNGSIFARGSTFPGRHIAGIRIQALIGRLCAPGTTWACVFSRTIEFIAPDTWGDIGIVPLTPNLCLVANSESGEISEANAIEINQKATEASINYYFGRDL